MIELLRGGCSLTTLDLTANSLRDAGCAAVATALVSATQEGNCRLQGLLLGDNRAGYATAKAMAQLLSAPGLVLTHLDLSRRCDA